MSIYFLNVLQVEYRDPVGQPALPGLYRRIQLHPEKTAVFRVRVDAHNRTFKPALALPKIGIEENFYTITDTEGAGYHPIIPDDMALLFQSPRHIRGDSYAQASGEWPGSHRCDTSSDR